LHWDFLAKLSRRQLVLLRETMMLGDGTGQNRFCGQEREVFYMTLIQTMLGMPTTFYQQEKLCWRTRVIDATGISMERRSTVPSWEGEIWCPSVDTGFWVAERKGLMFITGNTLSAWNIAGGGAVTGAILKNYLEPHERAFIWHRNWPAMIAFVLLLEPFLVQLIASGFSGDDDDKDKALMWNNEPGRKAYADITPMVRQFPWYEGAPTGDRRYYLHWGKQSYEVLTGWLQKPKATALGKASLLAKLAWELATGESLGSEWDLGFKNMGLMGFISDKDGQFGGSMAAHIGKSFIPFTFLTTYRNLDATPFTTLGPVSRGIGFNKASTAFYEVLKTWAGQETYRQLYQNGKVKANLEALGADILDAAARNGYDPAKVITGARGAVLKELYAEFYRALESQDTRQLEAVARKILRVNGTVDGIRRSIRNRDQLYGKVGERTPDQLAAVAEAFRTP
jgi:hypothetical protein